MVQARFRVKSDNMWNLTGSVSMDTFPGFGIPEFHVAIIGCGEKLSTIVVESYVCDRL